MENSSGGAQPNSGQTQSRAMSPLVVLILSVVAVALLIALAVWWHKRSAEEPLQASQASTFTQEYDERIGNAPSGTTFDLVFDGAKLVKGPKTITVAKGSNVRVSITVQGKEEIKATLAGYDIITEANPEAPGAFSFIADQTGEFTFYAIDEEGEAKAAEHTAGSAADGTSLPAKGDAVGKIIVR